MKPYRIRRLFTILLLAVWGRWFTISAAAAAAGVPAVMTAEDEENGYRYECVGIGSFSTNIQQGETAAAAVITAAEGLEWELYRDGILQDYENGELIFESGSYKYYLYPTDGREYLRGVFSFSLEGMEESGDGENLFVVEDEPEISLSFDRERNVYVHTLPNGEFFTMTIPRGAAGTGSVSVELSEGVTVYGIQKDGETGFFQEPYVFDEPGIYEFTCMTSFGGTNTGGGIYYFTIPFLIMPDQTGSRDLIWAPIGFTVQSAWRNGTETAFGRDFLETREDGIYRITFAWEGDTAITYTLSFQADHTPPALVFTKDIYDPLLKAPLEFNCAENGCQVEIYRNGVQTAELSGKISDGGQYRIRVTDPAGNVRVYQFQASNGQLEIRTGEIILLALSVAAAVGWLVYQRRHMRVL